jgi:glycopeptide antibiotics resistance protein
MNSTGQNHKPESLRKRRARKFGLLLFVIYLIVLTYFLFFADWYDHAPGKHWTYHANLIPFLEILRFCRYAGQLSPLTVFLNLVGNILGFLPFGFFLPVIARKNRRFLKVTLLGCLTSVLVELVQLVTRTGVCDIDDVILNTAGAALGYLLFLLADNLRIRR